MPPTLLAPDIQATYRPVWFIDCPQLPRVYATRDIDIPFVVPSLIFTIGDSVVGGEDLVGGGAGPQFKQAYRGILNRPVVTRRIGDPAWPMVEVQDVTVELLDETGELRGDWRGAPFTLSAYDAESGFLLVTGTFTVFRAVHNRGRVALTGKNVDLSILEAEIPKGLIDTTTFPLAADVGACPTWLFGNVVDLPLQCVRDDQVTSQFDYLLCRGAAAALTGLRRVSSTAGAPAADLPASFEMTFDELEPYPGQDGVLENGGFESWDAGPAVAPDGWGLLGAGATVAKTITAGEFDEGAAAAAITAAAAYSRLVQDLTIGPVVMPISWWQGREITIMVDVRATVAARAFLRVTDGVNTFDSPFHTGGGTFETLTVGTVGVPCVIAATATSANVVVGIAAGAVTTAQFDNVRVYMRAKSFAECLRPDLYDGYTAIRPFLRQEDSSGSLFQLAADVHGLQPERNPVRAVRTLLSDSTHGLGKAVDATSFDAAEIAATLTYPAAILLDAPEVFIPFSTPHDNTTATTVTVKDYSGHERHATYTRGSSTFVDMYGNGPLGELIGISENDGNFDNSDGDTQFVAIPYAPAFDTQTLTLRVSLQIPALPSVTQVPIVEKLVGATMRSGYGIYREANALVFFVRGTDTNLYTITSALTNPADRGRWIDVVGTAGGGVLALYRDGNTTPAATGTYSSSIATGAGSVLISKFGTGSVQVGMDMYDNVAIFSTVLTPARIAAHYAAIILDDEPVGTYDRIIITDLTPVFYYMCSEELGDPAMGDSATGTHPGVWVGGPTLGTGSPLTPERGYVNSGSSVRFKNDVSKYGIETGMTLLPVAATLAGWYKPTALNAKAGLVEKTIGSPGVRDTQWGFCQRGAAVRLTLVHAAGTLTLDVPLLAEDVGRWTFLVATWASGAVQVYKNGVPAIAGTYTAPVASGVGDFYIGVQGSSGAATRTRPALGYLGRWSFHNSALTAADIATLWRAATWYNGGLYVDVALRDARAARAWLEQLCLLRGIRLGVTADGAITCTVDAAAATTMRLHARDGSGDGERTIMAIGDLQYPPLDETVADVVVKGRRDLLSDSWLVERRRTVHANMGKDRVYELDCVREYPALDRVADYLAGRLLAGERTVDVTMGPEARQLMEAELVEVTDALLGLDAEVMETRSIGKSIVQNETTLAGWSEEIYTWTPQSYPSGAQSG